MARIKRKEVIAVYVDADGIEFLCADCWDGNEDEVMEHFTKPDFDLSKRCICDICGKVIWE